MTRRRYNQAPPCGQWLNTAVRRMLPACLACLLALASLGSLSGCGGSGGGATSGSERKVNEANPAAAASSDANNRYQGETSGPSYSVPSQIIDAASSVAPTGDAQAGVDVSTAAQGYVSAAAVNDSRLKLQVAKGDLSYNYDLPNDGTPIAVPLNLGDGSYRIRVMQNTSDSNYVEIAAEDVEVQLESEFAPYLRPNVYCSFTENSAAVAKARELAADATNEGDVARAIFSYIAQNITYDKDKASALADATGYVPNPDDTLASGTGICFDYASLTCAMFRSLGIPCQIVTGYVNPHEIYHAWNMVYIDGSWHCVAYDIDANNWTRMDLTFYAANDSDTVGDGTSYTDRFVY